PARGGGRAVCDNVVAVELPKDAVRLRTYPNCAGASRWLGSDRTVSLDCGNGGRAARAGLARGGGCLDAHSDGGRGDGGAGGVARAGGVGSPRAVRGRAAARRREAGMYEV